MHHHRVPAGRPRHRDPLGGTGATALAGNRVARDSVLSKPDARSANAAHRKSQQTRHETTQMIPNTRRIN
jgi:hypothetical protein